MMMAYEGAKTPGVRRAESIDELGDEDLALAALGAKQGSREDFGRLVDRLGPSLYRFLVVRLRDESDARDALQETLIAAWQSLPQLRRLESVRAWLFTIAVRKAGDVFRGRPSLTNVPLKEATTPDAAGLVELQMSLQELPPRMREVVLLRYLVGLSERETAGVLGVRVGTVKSRSARAREQLAHALAGSIPLD
jgi:RNA polymerase sigma factor (sigma-70 family)